MNVNIIGNPVPTSTVVHDISGRWLSRRLTQGSATPTYLALLAYQLERGEVIVRDLTRKQALSLTHASGGYVSTLAKLTEEERQQVKTGKLSLAAAHQRRREPTDADVDWIVA